jgi:serine/threonine protein kinase, bacterial
MSFASGTTFVGYTVQRPLSSDEMGDLYLAQHPRLPHWNALKVLSATLTEDREFRDRCPGRRATLPRAGQDDALPAD